MIRNNHPVASRWNSWNPAEKLSFLVTGSIFLPYYFAAVALCCGAFLVLVQPKQWGKVWAKSQRNWLLAMGALVILLPLWRKNWMGLGMGMGLGNIFANNMQQMQQMNQNQASQPRQNSVKVCPHCNTELHGNPKFCPNCGQSLKLTCPDCGTEVKASAKFCPECGRKLK